MDHPLVPSFEPTPQQLLARSAREWGRRTLAAHDAARASAPMVTLVAVTEFTFVTDDDPFGRAIRMGGDFQGSEFDLPRLPGQGLPGAEASSAA